jgi:hypothetical protein
VIGLHYVATRLGEDNVGFLMIAYGMAVRVVP